MRESKELLSKNGIFDFVWLKLCRIWQFGTKPLDLVDNRRKRAVTASSCLLAAAGLFVFTSFPNSRMGGPVENCLAEVDTHRIFATSLHQRKLECLDYI